MNLKFVFLSLVLGILLLDLVFAPPVTGSGTAIVSGGTTPGTPGSTGVSGAPTSSGPKTVILGHSTLVAPGAPIATAKTVGGVGSGLVVSKLPCENVLVCWSKMLKKFSNELNSRISPSS